MPQLSIAIVAGLGGMLGWGLADFFAKKTIDELGDVATLFWSLLIGSVPLGLLFLTNPVVPEKLTGAGGQGFLYLGVLGVWSALSYLPLYAGFGKGKVTLLSPVFASYAAVVVIISAALFGETLSVNHLAVLALIFVGIVFITGDIKSLWSAAARREPVGGLKEILLAVALYAPWLVALDRFIGGEYWVPYLLGIRIVSAFTVFCYTRVRRISLAVRQRSLWKYLCAIAFADVTAFAFLSWGYSASSSISIITMLSAAFSLPTMILAILFLKEKVTRSQLLGGLIVVAGAMVLPLV